MGSIALIDRLTPLIDPVVVELGLRLVDIEYAAAGNHSTLRLFIDREGGIGLEELARASHEIEAVLDAHDAVPGAYSLECSSPGVNRRLKGREDFLAHVGMQVRVRTVEAIEGSRNFVGELLSVDTESLQLSVADGVLAEIPLGAIEKANYVHDFAGDLRERRATKA